MSEAQRRGLSYFKLFVQDFRDGCASLSNEQMGVYFRVLLEIYDAVGPIPFNIDVLAKRLKVQPRKAERLIQELIDARKLFLTSGTMLSNHRAEREIENVQNLREKLSKNARKKSIPSGKNEKKQGPGKSIARSQNPVTRLSTLPRGAASKSKGKKILNGSASAGLGSPGLEGRSPHPPSERESTGPPNYSAEPLHVSDALLKTKMLKKRR